jgi:hypothetical protein
MLNWLGKMLMREVRRALEFFCREFVEQPYLCYTEHGLHARFYCLLWRRLPKEKRYVHLGQKDIAVLQKEYPTAKPLGKSKRQHWDVSVIKPLTSSDSGKTLKYDFLPLECVMEFGLNSGEEHLKDDIDRLCHPDSNVQNGIIVHLYRLSERTSARDLSPRTRRLVSPERMLELVCKTNIEVYYALYDDSGRYESCACRVYDAGILDLTKCQ